MMSVILRLFEEHCKPTTFYLESLKEALNKKKISPCLYCFGTENYHENKQCLDCLNTGTLTQKGFRRQLLNPARKEYNLKLADYKTKKAALKSLLAKLDKSEVDFLEEIIRFKPKKPTPLYK